MKKWLPILALLIMPHLAAAPASLTISASMTFKNTLQTLGAAFEKANPNVRLSYNFGATGALATQIEMGAPVDFFVCADERVLARLTSHDKLLTGKTQVLASTSLVLVKSRKNRQPIKSLADLPKFARIALGNPDTVASGKYAQQCLQHLNLWNTLINKMIFTQNVAQTTTYLVRGEIDAGFIFTTDFLAAKAQLVQIALVPDSCHDPITLSLAAIKGTTASTWTDKFLAFARSEAAQKIIVAAGYRVATSTAKVE